MNLIEKIITHNSVGLKKRSVKCGDIVVVKVARTLASEITQVGIQDTIRYLGVKKLWRDDKFFLAVDHSVDPANYHEEKVRKRIKVCDDFSKEFNVKEYYGPNQSILHTEFYRQKAIPGTIIVGADSHSCSHGCIGALAMGMGASDTCMPLICGKTWLQVPEVIQIKLIGEPNFAIVGKDIILHILKKFGRNTIALQRVVEFSGNIKCLSVDSRFAICNMVAEFGGIAGVFPGDEVTQEFIQKRKNKSDEIPLYFRADEDAQYAGKYEVDLRKVEPLVAKYPSPDNCYLISDPQLYEPIIDNGIKVCDTIKYLDGVFLGACTSTQGEIILAGLLLDVMLRKYSLKPKKRLDDQPQYQRILTPGSVIMSKYLERIGILNIYRQAGFRVDAAGCSMCLGISHQKALPGEIWLSSQNRNFRNRMGKGSIGNLASACTVAASSFSMQIIDPRKYINDIDQVLYNDLTESKRLRPVQISEPNPIIVMDEDEDEEESTKINKNEQEIIRGLPQIFGDDVDTDIIIPAPFIVLRGQELANKSFHYYRPEFMDKLKLGHDIVVAGKGFGSGSSREEAVSCLKIAGVKCIIAKSFSFIFYRNLLTLNMLGVIIKDENFYNNLTEMSQIQVNVEKRKVIVNNKQYPFTMSSIEETIYQNGGVIGLYEKYKDKGFSELVKQAVVKTENKGGCGSGGCSNKDLDW
jgi:3-isopropylmalate dehydratase small subunit